MRYGWRDVRTLYDAVTPANIPASAQMVAGYVDGRYAWRASDWARFPNAVKVRIAVFASTDDGHVLDVEPGDATPAQAVGWVQRRRAAGVDPTVYCGLSTSGYSWAQVRAAFQAAGVAEPHYWVAAYPGIGPALYPGSVAHQYANPGPYDLSVVADYWPGVDGASTVSNVLSALPTVAGAPGPLTATLPEDDMTAQFETDVRAQMALDAQRDSQFETDVRADLAAKGQAFAAFDAKYEALDRDLRADLLNKGAQITALTATVATLSGLLGQQQGLDVAAVKKAVADAIAAGVHVNVSVG